MPINLLLLKSMPINFYSQEINAFLLTFSKKSMPVVLFLARN